MNRFAVILAVTAFAAVTPVASFAAMHGADGMHGTSMHDGGHAEHKGDVAHEEVVDGVKATFRVMSMADHMKAMKMELPKELKETHHLAVEFKDAKTGKQLVEGDVKVKVVAPDKSEQVKDLMAMQGHFGADFVMGAKGKYGVMAKFKVSDGTVRSAKFWFDVK